LRAGTYVTGISPDISSGERPLGTAISLVSAEAPKTRRSTGRRVLRGAQALRDARAASSSTLCRWP